MTQFYVDDSGKVCDTRNAPQGFHFEAVTRKSEGNPYILLYVVRDSDSEVVQEAVLWDAISTDADGFFIHGVQATRFEQDKRKALR